MTRMLRRAEKPVSERLPMICIAIFLAVVAVPGNSTVQAFTNDAPISYSGAVTPYYGIDKTEDVANTGQITISLDKQGVVYGYGIHTQPGVVTNSGAITTSAKSGIGATSSYVESQGIFANGSAIYNSGAISAQASASCDRLVYAGTDATAKAYGIYGNLGAVTNTGNITARAVSSSVPANWDGAYAYGIYSNSAAVTNSGNISATASAANGAYAFGIYSRGVAVNNSGNITVSATGAATRAFAYGIYIDDTATLTNTGIIRAADSNAYEVKITGGTVTLVDRYHMHLDGTPSKGSIYVDAGATLNLNNALLTATAENIRFNTEYKIFDGIGTVIGNFSGARFTTNPAVTLLYHDQGTVGSADDTVSLSYHPATSSVLKGVEVTGQFMGAAIDPVRERQAHSLMEGLISGSTSIQVAAGGSTASDAQPVLLKISPPESSVYFIPYYVRLKNTSDALGYTTNSAGVAAGYDRHFGAHQLGFHLGVGSADSSFSGREFPADTSDRQTLLNLGLHGLSRWGKWTVRGDATGFYDRHDYSAVTGMNFEGRESANFNSYGTAENLAAGYTFRWGSHVFLPEIGVNHVWIRQDAFTSHAAGGWQTDYAAADSNQVYGTAALRWLGRFALADFVWTPSVAMGGRCRLTNGSLTIDQTVPGSSTVTISADQNRTAMMASASLAIAKGSFSAEASYNGEYSADTTLHAVWLKFGYMF
jgi:hypothetical protein